MRLDESPSFTPSTVLVLSAIGITTVEQLARMSIVKTVERLEQLSHGQIASVLAQMEMLDGGKKGVKPCMPSSRQAFATESIGAARRILNQNRKDPTVS